MVDCFDLTLCLLMCLLNAIYSPQVKNRLNVCLQVPTGLPARIGLLFGSIIFFCFTAWLSYTLEQLYFLVVSATSAFHVSASAYKLVQYSINIPQ